MLSWNPKNTFNEQAIIEGIRNGGPQRRLFENALFEHFIYLVKQYGKKYTLPEEEAASAYSDTIIAVIDHITSGRFCGHSSLKTYTCQIFMYKCVDLVRKKTTIKNSVHNALAIDHLITVLPDTARGIIQELITKNERSLVLEKLQTIGEKCRQGLLLFEDGYSDREIALQLEYKSADVVKTSRMRCLEKLKGIFFTTHS